MRRGLILAALLALAPAAAQAQAKARSAVPPVALRGSTPPTPLKAPAAPSPPTTDPRLLPPSLVSPAAPRLGGLAATDAGGAQCRTDCAKTRYLCLSQDDQDGCSAAWSQCVAACPAQSAGPL